MSTLNVQSAELGGSLSTLLTAADIQPGDDASYQTCKTIYAYHPMGGKLADFPIQMAQSQPRKITVPKGPEERLVEAFEDEWRAISADKHIENVARLARVYGVASVALMVEGVDSDKALDFDKLADAEISINVFDPLNTSGSLVLSQDPNSMDFQKVQGIAVQGQAYHRSRTVTLLNEDPIYIEYTQSAFGYVGRSVYQRALFQLKSFVNSLITDNMIVTKAGVLVAKMQQQSSAIDQMMAAISGQKRELLKEAQTGNVLSISVDESIESLDLNNLEAPYTTARKNIIENIASASGTPAKLLLSETFAAGFGEGTEDAKHIAMYINGIREWMTPLYIFFEKVVRYRAWNEEFYKTIQEEFPNEYKGKSYKTAFYEWSNSFAAEWPSLLEEPDSEKIKVSDVQLKAVIALLEVLLPAVDAQNKVELIKWACDNFNALKLLFPNPLVLDFDAMIESAQNMAVEGETEDGEEGGEDKPKEPKAPKPFADAMAEYSAAVARLPDRRRK